MTFRSATNEETATWDELLLGNPDKGNIFASKEIADTKAGYGWTPRFIVSDDPKLVVLALEKRIPLLGRFWYLPKGPGTTTPEELQPLLTPLKTFAAAQGVFTVKIESEIPRTPENLSELTKMGLKKTFAVQPNASTVLVDLTPDIESVLMSLNQKGRNALRRAEREGVTTRPVELTDENMQTMYALLRQTAEGQWHLRDYAYFKDFWTRFSASGHGQLFFAEYQGAVIAASYGLLLGTKGMYKDGASIRQKVVYGASHLLQWEMIKWMKTHGATSYDLCGTPPSDQIHNPDHAFAGLARFKTSFNKTVTDYVGCYELPVAPFAYTLWKKIVEKIALRLHRMRSHTEWY